MRRIGRVGWPSAAAAAVLLAAPLIARAVDPAISENDQSLLQPYEPITAGYTKDSDDVPYLDVTLSLKLRLLPTDWLKSSRLFLTFTGRFGFYWGTRFSSPVIGKSYNPKLLWRYFPSDAQRNSVLGKSNAREHSGYLDFAYAHQSNGQTISTAEQYAQAQSTQERPEFANDYISRGWDYLELVWKKSYWPDRDSPLASYVDLKYFLSNGLLQGRPEEYNTWENDPQGKPRRAVDGLTGLIEYQSHWRSSDVREGGPPLLNHPSVWLKYQTGYDRPFKYSTVRLEGGVRIGELPFAVWIQNGYMSDLANYYRKVTSYGIELRVGQF
jgi:hypothetical protein